MSSCWFSIKFVEMFLFASEVVIVERKLIKWKQIYQNYSNFIIYLFQHCCRKLITITHCEILFSWSVSYYNKMIYFWNNVFKVLILKKKNRKNFHVSVISWVKYLNISFCLFSLQALRDNTEFVTFYIEIVQI